MHLAPDTPTPNRKFLRTHRDRMPDPTLNQILVRRVDQARSVDVEDELVGVHRLADVALDHVLIGGVHDAVAIHVAC